MNQTQALETLDRYIRARYPVIAVLSHEETRVMAGIKAVAAGRKMAVAEWTVTAGLVGEGFQADSTKDPIPAIEAMLAHPVEKPTLFVMKDLHGILGNPDRGFDPMTTRYLRDLANKFETSKSSLVLLSPAFAIPPDLSKTIVLIDWPLPDIDELTAVLKKCEEDLPESFPVTLNGARERVIQALRGLTVFEASSVLLSGIVATRKLGDDIIPFIVREKAQIIKKAGVLEYFDTTVTMSQVGGLAYLKEYAMIKRNAFGQKAADAGVDAPKGVLLAGIPGTGKSLAAKAIAGGQMPLLRMDVGALMGGLVGQSESNMRAALKVAEAVAPAVLWVDEVDKALGGGGNELDGGTSARVFGTLLTWMQETAAPVYVVATANNLGVIKDELIRRFDDVFWVDLPNCSDRVEILSVHLAKRKQDPAAFNLEQIARATWGYTGAEIEKAVKSAIERAFFDHAALTDSYLLNAAAQIVPLSKMRKEQLEKLRSQVPNAQAAGDPLEPQPEGAGMRKADLAGL